MTQHLDDSTAILWGSTERSLTWVVLSRKHGKTVIAKAAPDRMWVSDHASLGVQADYESIADDTLTAWLELRRGHDLEHRATHHLQPPHHNDIVPLENSTGTPAA